jgi:hypothetical protein
MLWRTGLPIVMRGPVGKTVRVGGIGPGGEYAGVHIGAKRTTRVQPPRRAAVSLKELSMSRYPSIPPTPPAYTPPHPRPSGRHPPGGSSAAVRYGGDCLPGRLGQHRSQVPRRGKDPRFSRRRKAREIRSGRPRPFHERVRRVISNAEENSGPTMRSASLTFAIQMEGTRTETARAELDSLTHAHGYR